MKIRVYYEDTDIGGVVYHSNYLNFCERARSDAFFKKGLSPVLDSGHFVAGKVVAEYLLGAKLGDLLTVKTELVNIKAASFVLKQTIYRNLKKVFKMDITLVYVNFDGKPQRLSRQIIDTISSLFAK